MVAARRRQLGCRRRSADAGARRHRPLQRPAGLRLDLEPDRQHRRAASASTCRRRRPGNAFPFTPDPSTLQADAATGAGAAELRAERHRSGLQVPAGVAHQHRRRPPAAAAASSARPSSSTTRTSTASTTSTPTCRRRSRPSPASTPGRAGSARRARHRQRRRLRHPHQQRRPATRSTQRYVLKNTNDGSSWNFAQSLSKTLGFGLSRPRRLQLRPSRTASPIPSRRRRPASRATAHFGRPEQPGRQLLDVVAGPPRVRAGQLQPASTSASARPASRCSGRRGRARNTASSRVSYIFAGDMNGDGVGANDLIYIPRDVAR